MSIHHAPQPGSSARDRAPDHPEDGWDADAWDDAAYDEPPLGQVLWGRVAAFALVLLLAFLAGRLTAGDGSAAALAEAQAQAEELRAELSQARTEIDALVAGGGDTAAPEEPQTEGDAAGDGAAAAEEAEDADADAAGSTDEVAGSTDEPAAVEEAPADESPAQTYTVEPGDNLFGLAERFYGDGQEWRAIAEANDLGAGAVLSPGQTLEIPEA